MTGDQSERELWLKAALHIRICYFTSPRMPLAGVREREFS